MLVQNRGADRDQHKATDDLRTLSRETAKDAAEHDAERHHHQRREADHQRNDADIHVEKREADTYRHRVDTGGKAGGGKAPEAMPALGGISSAYFAFWFESGIDHVQAEKAEQSEGDPVVLRGDVLCCRQTQ